MIVFVSIMKEIKQIHTYTLSDSDVDCKTYSKTLNFLVMY